MARSSLLIALVLGLAGSALAAGGGGVDLEHFDHGDVNVLTSANFDTFLKENPFTAVEFFAPWCGHCKSLAPEWKAAATTLKADGIKIANVDATQEADLAKKYGVSGYPTIKIFRNGKDSEYNGPRQADGIVTYLQDQSAPNARKLTALELEAQLLKLREGAPESLVVLFAAKDSDVEGRSPSKLASAFLTLAETAREAFSFCWTSDPAAAAAHGLSAGTVAILHSPLLAGSKLEPAVKVFADAPAALGEWVWPASLPLVGELTPRTAARYGKAEKTVVRVGVPTNWESDAKGSNYFLNRIRKVAAEFPSLAFAVVKPDSQLAQIADFGLEKGDFSITAEAPPLPGGSKFKADGLWSAKDSSALTAFAEALVAGGLEPYIKSEPEPEGLAGGVTVVTGRSFDRLVLDDSKDVFIEFYAPWCGHCKSLAPKYEELAQLLAPVETLLIAKLDATANDWSRKNVYEVKGFPTIYFKPAGGEPVVYDGARETKDMAAWLSTKATHSFAVPGGEAPKKKSKKAKQAADEL